MIGRMATGATVLVLAVLSACGRVSEDRGDIGERQLRAVATTSIVADLIREVGGERVQVISLMGAGVDPHLYRASEGDVRRMTEADIVFYNGLHLEGRMSELFEQMGEQGVSTTAVTAGIDPSRLMNPPEFQGAYDPHVWMDVSMWRDASTTVAEALVQLDSANAEGYQARAAAYADRLIRLDEEVRERVSRIPPDDRVLVTAHDAFNYFGRAYGFEVRGLQGISTVAEAGTADVQELARFVAERRIPALFVETSVSPRSIEAVRAAVRSRGFDVSIGGNLYSDALGGAGSGAESYESMILHNVDAIVTALTAGE